MIVQVIWKIKHQNLNFQGKGIYAHKSYYQLMGFVWIPSDLFRKCTPCCLDEYIMWTKPEYIGFLLALSLICQVIPLWFPKDAGNQISMYIYLTVQNDIYIFFLLWNLFQIVFKNFFLLSSFFSSCSSFSPSTFSFLSPPFFLPSLLHPLFFFLAFSSSSFFSFLDVERKQSHD